MLVKALLFVAVIWRMPKRIYAPSTLSLGLPVSTNIATPTLYVSSRLPTTACNAAFSMSNAVFQLAVLSTKMRTFGRSAAKVGLARKMSVSSLTGSNTGKAACGTASSAAAATVRRYLA